MNPLALLAVVMAVANITVSAFDNPPPHHVEVALIGTTCILMLLGLHLILDRVGRRDMLVIVGSQTGMWLTLYAFGVL